MKANIVDIKHLAVHDGDGIRTTVFFKGCPLKCVWCHNPESIDFGNQLGLNTERCINCLECLVACKEGAHAEVNGIHVYNRESCINCGECAKACLNSAITFYGKEYTVDKLLPLLLEDRIFYQTSGGGVTLSGGECLMQADFCKELLKKLKSEGISTAVDTCGFVPTKNIEKVLPYTDVFLYDIKAIDEDVHIKCTGQSNSLILENLNYINSMGKKIYVRVPYVPQYNDNQIEKIAKFIKPLKNVKVAEALSYHNFAGSKYDSLGMVNTLPKILPTGEEVEIAQDKLSDAIKGH